MRFYIILALFCCSCGGMYVLPNGLEVHRGQFDIEDVDVARALQFVEAEFSYNYEVQEDFSLYDLIDEEGLSIHFKSINNRSVELKDDGVLGYYEYETHKIVVYVKHSEIPYYDCLNKYQVLTHELLHFIAHEYLKWDGKPHMYPYMFIKWAERNGVSKYDTVEVANYVRIVSYCGETYPLDAE